MVMLTVAVVLAVCSADLARIRVDPSTQFFIDESGRTRIFHGVNAVEKVVIYFRTQSHALAPIDFVPTLRWPLSILFCLGLMRNGVSLLWTLRILPDGGLMSSGWVSCGRHVGEIHTCQTYIHDRV